MKDDKKLFIEMRRYKELVNEATERLAILPELIATAKDEKEIKEAELLIILWLKSKQMAEKNYVTMRNSIVLKYGKFVHSLASKHLKKLSRNHMIPEEDLFQNGQIGLMTAIEKFDVNRGVKFLTYGKDWIKAYLFKASIGHNYNDVDMPIDLVWKHLRYLKTKGQLHQNLGCSPSSEEICRAMDISAEDLDDLVKFQPVISSISQPISEVDEDYSLGDLIGDEKNICLIEITEENQKAEKVWEILEEKLSEREMKIVSLRHGFRTGVGHNFCEIGQEIGISHERVRQIYQKALRKVRSDLAKYYDWEE